LSEILPSSGSGLGPDDVGQKGLKQLHLWCHSQKKTIKKQNFLFIADLKTCQVFEGLNSSLALLAPEIFLCKGTCKLLVFKPK